MAAVAPVAQDVVFQARGLTKVYHMGDADERALTRFRRQHVGFVFQFYNLIPSPHARMWRW